MYDMDNRLIPPSHFDPNEQDSLENTPSTSSQPDGYSILPETYVSNETNTVPGVNFHLRPPEDFSSSLSKANQNLPPLLQIGKPLSQARNLQNFITGQYQTPPQISRNQEFPLLPQNDPISTHLSQQQQQPEKFTELLRLKAENEALKSVIQSKKSRKIDKENAVPGNCNSNAHQAVIEHQTQHISRLQRDIEEQKELLLKRGNEVSQYQAAMATREEDYKKLESSVERLESQIERKNEEEKSYHQEIEGLQTIVRDLRLEKEEISKSNSSALKLLREKFSDEQEENSSNLTKKIEELNKKHENEKFEFEKKIQELEYQHKKKLQEIENQHKNKIIEMNNDLKDKEKNHIDIVNEMKQKIESFKSVIENLEDMSNNMKTENQKLQDDNVALQSSLRTSQQTCEKFQDKISQLQTYIGEQQTEDYERSQWKNHKKQYEENIVSLQGEKESLSKTLELQNIRLQSITKILTTQEEAIQANTKSFSTGNIKGNPEHVIIRRWREKVFELMVQLKSNEISTKNLQNSYNLAEKDLNEKFEEEQRVSVILENQLCECKAQLEMKERENTLMSGSNQHLIEKLKESQENLAQLEETVVTMSETITKSTAELCQEFQTKFSGIAEKTVHLEQRIVFANNRLRTVQDLLLRRDNLWKAKFKQIKAEQTKGESTEQSQEEELITPQVERPDLVAEISQLMKERDILGQRLSSDSASYESATANFKQRESELEKNVTELQHDVQQKSEVIAELKIQLESLEDKMKDYERVASDAKESEQAVKDNCTKDIEEKLEEAWRTWDKEKTELEKRLEESQREHARTVVTSRQSERNAIRERKRAAENLQAVVEDCRKETEKLQTRVKVLQQDNNMLMTTLRQQGLLSTFREARAQARISEQESDTSLKNQRSKKSSDRDEVIEGTGEKIITSSTDKYISADVSSTSKETQLDNENECTAALLKDLVVLTENILCDSD